MARKKSIVAVGLVLIAVPVMMAGYAARQQAAETAEKPQNPPQTQTLKIDADLVQVTVTVTDPQNRYVTGLEKEHFQVWEDKVEQTIEYFSAEDVPLSLGIVFDVSGSMKDKISEARDAAVTFLKNGNPDDEHFLGSFSNRAEI